MIAWGWLWSLLGCGTSAIKKGKRDGISVPLPPYLNEPNLFAVTITVYIVPVLTPVAPISVNIFSVIVDIFLVAADVFAVAGSIFASCLASVLAGLLIFANIAPVLFHIPLVLPHFFPFPF